MFTIAVHGMKLIKGCLRPVRLPRWHTIQITRSWHDQTLLDQWPNLTNMNTYNTRSWWWFVVRRYSKHAPSCSGTAHLHQSGTYVSFFIIILSNLLQILRSLEHADFNSNQLNTSFNGAFSHQLRFILNALIQWAINNDHCIVCPKGLHWSL